MAQTRKTGCCGTLQGGKGWDGIQRQYIGECDKKPRKGNLTCWWHRTQESEARRKNPERRVETGSQ